MENIDPGYKDMSNDGLQSLFGFNPPGDYICVWPWETAPIFLKQFSTFGGDEDGIVWVPNLFLTFDVKTGMCIINHPINRLWGNEDGDYFRFSDGMLIIWAHS